MSFRTALFAATAFVGSSLLFVVQPMVAKLVLPLLGGAPAVWNTCMVFFQACLLLGYAYAHFSTKWMNVRAQATLHVLLLAAAVFFLPLALPKGWLPPAQTNPVGWVLLLLVVSVGLPFAIVSATAPLIQKWFAISFGAGADPYPLYSASNAGSMLALLSYPLFVEPSLKLRDQTIAWSCGYGVLTLLICACALTAVLRLRQRHATAGSIAASGERVTWSKRFRWILLALVPASYLLGVTTYITTDLAAVPLLWVLPLALYLLSFIIVFSVRPILRHAWMIRALPVAVLIVVLWTIAQLSQPLWLVLGAHLVAFFITAMVCHGELVRLRPASEHLTDFYLMISIGGVLGGMFNALLAPLIFSRPMEYPLAIVAACLLCPARGIIPGARRAIGLDLVIPLVVGITTFALLYALRANGQSSTMIAALMWLPLVICLGAQRRPVRFALSVGAALLAGSLLTDPGDQVLLVRRSFFGVHRVARDAKGPFHELYHGTTLHGRQFVDLKADQPVLPEQPLTYYHRSGPVGEIVELLERRANSSPVTVGAVGLGTGSVAAYAAPGSHWAFYEIDPVVLALARDSGAFSYLSAARSRGANMDFVLGDARLTLAKAPDHSFDLLILDAFSSDSIPIHLLTRQAMQIYRQKLRPDGWIAIHISNQYLDLRPVVANLAGDAGMTCVIGLDTDPRSRAGRPGKESSIWALLTPTIDDVVPLATDPRWTRLGPDASYPIWTDDFSNIVSLLRWNQ